MISGVTAYFKLAQSRNEDLWGEDALLFNPERWLEYREKSGALVGVYANL